MLTGKSIQHVNQNLGLCMNKSTIEGYYNNLTEKVTKSNIPLDSLELPSQINAKKESFVFPVDIFQYGLGAYDLWLLEKNELYLNKFLQCANWAVDNIDEKGRWNNFFFIYPDNPYGAMAQGEGASLLIRAYLQTNDEIYLQKAKEAIDYMLTPLEEGGTTKIESDQVYLMEYTHKDVVLNGFIFAWWGLYDFVTIISDKDRYKQYLDRSLETLISILPRFNNKIWTNYNLENMIASPFYHKLHIAQMQAMYELTEDPIFKKYQLIWEQKKKNFIFVTLAFVKKAYQKILE